MKHYRVNKLAKPDGRTVKTKDILASNDKEALRAAQEDGDCPTCEVLQSGLKVGSITTAEEAVQAWLRQQYDCVAEALNSTRKPPRLVAAICR